MHERLVIKDQTTDEIYGKFQMRIAHHYSSFAPEISPIRKVSLCEFVRAFVPNLVLLLGKIWAASVLRKVNIEPHRIMPSRINNKCVIWRRFHSVTIKLRFEYVAAAAGIGWNIKSMVLCTQVARFFYTHIQISAKIDFILCSNFFLLVFVGVALFCHQFTFCLNNIGWKLNIQYNL